MSTLNNVLIGSVAGLAGGQALDRVAELMYERTNPEDIEREKAIEPRDPFIVLTQRVADRFGINLTKEDEKNSEMWIKLALSAAAGTAYVVAARRWPLGWVTGGMVFGTLFWLVEDEGMGPALGLAGDNRKYPAEAHLRGLAAHVAFGLTAALVAKTLGATDRG